PPPAGLLTGMQCRAIQVSRGSVVVGDCRNVRTSPISIMLSSAFRVGSGIVGVKPPIGSASRPLAQMNGAASTAVWVASRYGSPLLADSSLGSVDAAWKPAPKNCVV